MTELSLAENFRRLAEEEPDAVAITVGGTSRTRGELERRSNRLARAYVQAGVSPESVVGILLPNGVEFLEAAMAIWKCGATPLPLSVQMPARERDGIIALAKPSLVVGATGEEAVGFPVVPAGFEPDGTISDAPMTSTTAGSWKVTTSGGSTGKPKLIVSTQPALRSSVEPLARLLGMVDGGTALITGPLFHNAPFLTSVASLTLGGRVVLMERFDAEDALRLVDEHRADWMYAVPTMMNRIWRLSPGVRAAASLDSLRVVMHMAAPCPEWLKREWIDWLGGERIWEIYTATEVQAITLVKGDEWLERPGTVGRTVIGEVQILDAQQRSVPVGDVGEIWMRRGSGIPSPYTYIGAEPRVLDDGWESVGDLGRFDADGYLYLADRQADMFTVGGANVYPAEVEAALSEHPAVRSSVVIGLPHEDLGSVPHALVQLAGDVPDAELRAFLQERIARYKVPRSFERVTAPLRDDAGKVRRATLRADRL